MRVLRDPDAFMATDLAIARAMVTLGLATSTKEISAVSNRWRPWRSYAMAHLWSLPRVSRSKMTDTAG
jgi:AraC family transcriptional regulator of adaptative response / DNA-3-methyladenine glycosylase II